MGTGQSKPSAPCSLTPPISREDGGTGPALRPSRSRQALKRREGGQETKNEQSFRGLLDNSE